MAAYDSQYYTSDAMPIPHSGKYQYDGYYQSTDSTYSVSPPEVDGSITSGSGIPSYSNSAYSMTNSSYAGSNAGDYSQCDDSSISVSGIDMNEYMQDRFHEAYDPIPLDRTTVVQAQT